MFNICIVSANEVVLCRLGTKLGEVWGRPCLRFVTLWQTYGTLNSGSSSSSRGGGGVERGSSPNSRLAPGLCHAHTWPRLYQEFPSNNVVWTDAHFVQKLQTYILVPTKGTKMVATKHISLPENILKCVCNRVFARSPFGKHTALRFSETDPGVGLLLSLIHISEPTRPY